MKSLAESAPGITEGPSTVSLDLARRISLVAAVLNEVSNPVRDRSCRREASPPWARIMVLLIVELKPTDV